MLHLHFGQMHGDNPDLKSILYKFWKFLEKNSHWLSFLFCRGGVIMGRRGQEWDNVIFTFWFSMFCLNLIFTNVEKLQTNSFCYLLFAVCCFKISFFFYKRYYISGGELFYIKFVLSKQQQQFLVCAVFLSFFFSSFCENLIISRFLGSLAIPIQIVCKFRTQIWRESICQSLPLLLNFPTVHWFNEESSIQTSLHYQNPIFCVKYNKKYIRTISSYASSSTPYSCERVSQWVGRVSGCNLLA